jgi:hypothetical protein
MVAKMNGRRCIYSAVTPHDGAFLGQDAYRTSILHEEMAEINVGQSDARHFPGRFLASLSAASGQSRI